MFTENRYTHSTCGTVCTMNGGLHTYLHICAHTLACPPRECTHTLTHTHQHEIDFSRHDVGALIMIALQHKHAYAIHAGHHTYKTGFMCPAFLHTHTRTHLHMLRNVKIHRISVLKANKLKRHHTHTHTNNNFCVLLATYVFLENVCL